MVKYKSNKNPFILINSQGRVYNNTHPNNNNDNSLSIKNSNNQIRSTKDKNKDKWNIANKN